MSFLSWLEATWFRSASDARCFEMKVPEGDDESIMAPPFTQGLKLINGSNAILPKIGLGVYKVPVGQETVQTVLSALQAGYRHIDTAALYKNEADVGAAVRASGLPRHEIFITTKLWLADWGYEKAIAAVRRSLRELQMDYVDLMLLHAPGDPLLRPDTWRALEECQRLRLVRDIGVSNFSEAHLQKLAESATVTPAVNQVEIHPFLQRRALVKHCQERGIVVEAYSPLSKAAKLSDPTVMAVAQRHSQATSCTPAQVLIAWSLAKGLVPLPKSVRPERQLENLEAARSVVVLSDEDIAALDGLEEGMTTGWDPVTTDPV